MIDGRSSQFNDLVEYLKIGEEGYSLSFNHTKISCNLDGLKDVQEQYDGAILALKIITALTGIKFVQTSDEADIRFENEDNGAYCMHLETTETEIKHTFVNVEKTWMDYSHSENKWSYGAYGLQTFIHEICHALGLNHPGPYNGHATYQTDRKFDIDTWQYTIMSYFTQSEYTANNASFLYLMAPMMADLKALRDLYGALPVNPENTLYGKGETVWDGLTDLSENPNSTFCINDTGGYDILDFSNLAPGALIDLRAGLYSNVNGLTANVSVAIGTVLEEARGGSGNDVVNGNQTANRLVGNGGDDTLNGYDGNDLLEGGEGKDRLDGGAGSDTVGYSDAAAGVAASLFDATANRGAAQGDTYVSIENLAGSRFADELVGNSGDNILEGGEGEDRLKGNLGEDTASYEHAAAAVVASLADPSLNRGDAAGDTYDGVENLRGSAYGDTLGGDSGNNILEGGGGADILDGGAGQDTVSYAHATTGVVANLSNTSQNGGEASGDSYRGIENLRGSALDDTLTGDNSDNELDGGTGKDVLSGGGGNDTFVLGAEDDRVNDSAGVDTITSTISRSLLSYASIENLTLLGSNAISGKGNALANVITGNDAANILDGDAGLDRLIGGQGNDTYVLGTEYDSVVDSGGIDTITSLITRNLTNYASIENLILLGSGPAGAIGNGLNNILTGNAGNNRLDGGAGRDILIGGAGNDVYVLLAEFDTVTDSAGIDTIESSVTRNLASYRGIENLTLKGMGSVDGFGNEANNVLLGNTGANKLNGLFGNDILTGGAGRDSFLFSTAFRPQNVDTITDFSVKDDTILISSSLLSGMRAGALAASAFTSNLLGVATRATDRFIYESDTGKLFYDANGNAAGGAVQFATLSKNLALTALDFVLI